MITLKRGDTLSFIVTRKDDQGQPLTGDASKLKSQLRTREDKLAAEFSITETETPGDYLFKVDAQTTKDFRPGELYFDIEYRDDDIVYSSETMTVNVIKDVTRDEN